MLPPSLVTPAPTPEGVLTCRNNSGGEIENAMCCVSIEDFPNNCNISACGCSPFESEMVLVCLCPSGLCFDGSTCILDPGHGAPTVAPPTPVAPTPMAPTPCRSFLPLFRSFLPPFRSFHVDKRRTGVGFKSTALWNTKRRIGVRIRTRIRGHRRGNGRFKEVAD